MYFLHVYVYDDDDNNDDDDVHCTYAHYVMATCIKNHKKYERNRVKKNFHS